MLSTHEGSQASPAYPVPPWPLGFQVIAAILGQGGTFEEGNHFLVTTGDLSLWRESFSGSRREIFLRWGKNQSMRARLDRAPGKVKRARRLRSNATKSEQRMWSILRRKNLGFRFRRQHPVAGYVLDFYCRRLALGIETDGEAHDPERDARRDQALAELGIKTVRIPTLAFMNTESEIWVYLCAVLEARCKELGLGPDDR